MLNQKQTEIADILLKYLDEKGGKSNRDGYPIMFDNNGIRSFEWSPVVQILLEDLNLIKHWEDSDYWIMLTPNGNKAAKLGISKYIEQIEDDKELERKAKKASIKGVKTANRNSLIAIMASIAIPLLLKIAPIDQVTNSNTDSQSRANFTDSNITFNMADSTFAEKIKYSLKHDTLFLEDMRDLINNSE